MRLNVVCVYVRINMFMLKEELKNEEEEKNIAEKICV